MTFSARLSETSLSWFDLVLALCLGVLASCGVAAYSGPSSGDDTFIYMRYVQNYIRGEGFSFNPGEKSFGVTSTLWTLAMAPVVGRFGDSVATWKVAGASLCGARVAIMFLLLVSMGIHRSGAAGLSAFSILDPHSLRWSGSGMENSLVLIALLLVAVSFLAAFNMPQPRFLAATGALAGALPFVRPELGIISLVLMVGLTVRVQSSLQQASLWITAMSVLGALCMVVMSFFGTLLPQTALAKAVLLEQADPLYGARTVVQIVLSGGVGALFLVWAVKAKSAGLKWLTLAFGGLVLGCATYLSLQNQLVSTRYSSSLTGPLVLLATLLLAETMAARQRLTRYLWALIALQLAVTAGFLFYLFPATRVQEVEAIRSVGQDVANKTLPTARIATSEIGALGYYSGRQIIDLVGLVDRATITWAKNHGSPMASQNALERFLVDREATHYIETFGGASALEGQTLHFEVLGEYVVPRNNFSRGRVKSDTWRLYRLSSGEF